MAKTSLFLRLCLTSLIALNLPLAFAQDADTAKPKTRLSRPTASAALPPGGQPFSLGVQEQHVSVPETPLFNSGTGSVDAAFPPLNAGLRDGGAPIPQVDVGMGHREADVPSLTVQLLAKYNLELIVDQSMSMLTPDCPGFNTRWSWCGRQAHDLATQLEPFVPKGLTITAFAKRYTVYPNASAQNIADLFENPSFHGGTRLAEPLADRLTNYFANRHPGSKPMLIAVITDGVPVPDYEPAAVVDTIIKASHQMIDPHEITIVFFQIGGGDHKGRAFLHELDTNLVQYGAKYDMVSVVPFDRLEQIGLTQALVETIKDFASESHLASGNNGPAKRGKVH